MPSLTVENYLKAALQISLGSGSEVVSTGQLAAALDVSPGTVTSMLKALADADPPLADYRPYEGSRLTEAGRHLAMRMLRRHRLIELFLVQTLDLPWDQVHEEAENMEHAVSDALVDRIDEYLGHPACDPHGDPIPTAEGRMRGGDVASVPLSGCEPGSRIRLVRVLDQDSRFLRYLSDAGLDIGVTALVEDNVREAGIVTLRLASGSLSLGHSAAEELLVQTDNEGTSNAP